MELTLEDEIKFGKEQADDYNNKAYCEAEIDKAEDKIKELECDEKKVYCEAETDKAVEESKELGHTESTLEKSIEDTKELTATPTEERAYCEAAIDKIEYEGS